MKRILLYIIFLLILLPILIASVVYGQTGQNLVLKNLQANGVLNVQMFGAKTDGSDSYSAIQSAIDSLKVGNTLFFPRGTYTITKTLRINKDSVNLRSEKWAVTIKQTSADSNVIIVPGNRKNITFDGLVIVGNSAKYGLDREYGNGIKLGRTASPAYIGNENITIQNCYFTKLSNDVEDDNGNNIQILNNYFYKDTAGFAALHLRGTHNSRVFGNTMIDDTPGDNGAQTTPVNAIYAYDGEIRAHTLDISHNIVLGFGNSGFETFDLWIHQSKVSYNWIINSDTTGRSANAILHKNIAIRSLNTLAATGYNEVSYNHIDAWGSGIIVDAQDSTLIDHVSISHNTIRNAALGISVIQSGAAQPSTFISIEDNDIQDIIDSVGVGINIGVGIFLSNVKDVSVKGNTVKNCTHAGIFFWTDYKDVSVTENSVSDCEEGINLSTVSNKINYRVSVSKNRVKDIKSDGIILGRIYDLTVTGNNVVDCRKGAAVGGNGIAINTSRGVVVTGNRAGLTDLTAEFKQDYGLKLNADTSVAVVGNNFSRNKIGVILSTNNDESKLITAFNEGSTSGLVLRRGSFGEFLSFEKDRANRAFVSFHYDSVNTTVHPFRISPGKVNTSQENYGFVFGDSIRPETSAGSSTGFIYSNLNAQRGGFVAVMTNNKVHNVAVNSPYYSFLLGDHDSSKTEVARIQLNTWGTQNKGGYLTFYTKDSSASLASVGTITVDGKWALGGIGDLPDIDSSVYIPKGAHIKGGLMVDKTINYAGETSIGAGDTVKITQTGITATSIVFAQYANITAADSTLGPLGIISRGTNSFTIIGRNGNGKTVLWWAAKL